jgi:eukaryotic-like serine/threonine-protein kinase
VSTDDGRIGGRYELVRRIARGGGGTVWRARDVILGREVAVKEIHVPDELSPVERERARRRVLVEARAAARLDHPGAVVVHDVLDDGDDLLHLVMELVEAPTLRERVDRDGPLVEPAAAAIGRDLLDVLAVAHERGIVHRDVKPSNIFVLDDGGVKLADFGIAALTGETSLTRTGTALGSPSYLAPEQAQGETAAPPADLWGVGASLYFAVEGEPPFDRGNALATVQAVVHEDPRPFRRATSIAPLLRSLLDKSADRRPDLAEARGRLVALAGTGIDADTASPEPQAERTVALEPVPVRPEPDTPVRPEPDTPVHPEPDTPVHPEPDTPVHPEPERHTEPEPGPRRRVPLTLLAVLALAAIAGLGVLAAVTGGDGADDELTAEAPEEDPAEDAADPPGDDASGEGTTGEDDAEPAPEDDADASGGTDDAADDGDADAGGPTDIPEADVPDDWQVVEGETYRVAIPPGWEERSAAGNLTDYVDPSTGAYLRVDWTDDPAPDPVADWEENEAGFAARQDDYERVRLEPATYRGEDAALWEYAYADGGADLRALNLNLLAGDRAYALNLQSPAGDWEDVGALFPAIAGGFDPDG